MYGYYKLAVVFVVTMISFFLFVVSKFFCVDHLVDRMQRIMKCLALLLCLLFFQAEAAAKVKSRNGRNTVVLCHRANKGHGR